MDWANELLLVKRQLSKTPNSGDMFQPLKTKASRRNIALGDETILILRDHYDRQWSQRLYYEDNWVDHGLIFTNSKGGPICASYMIQVFKRLLVSANIPLMRFHDVRHTNASLLISHGIPPTTVARRLGHSKTSTTLDVYSHVVESQQREAAKLLDELISPIELHTNCTQPSIPRENATKNDDMTPDITEYINIDPK